MTNNTITTKTRTGNITTITTYAPTVAEQAGLLQAEQTLAFIESLDSEAYGWDCLRDVVMDQYTDILNDCKIVSVQTKKQSYFDFLQSEADELFESTLPPLPVKDLDQQLEDIIGKIDNISDELKKPMMYDQPEDWFPNDAMPWVTDGTETHNPEWMEDIGGYLFRNVNTGQVVCGVTFKSCAEMTGAHSRLLNLVWNGQRGHTAGWVKWSYSECNNTISEQEVLNKLTKLEEKVENWQLT